MWDVIAINFRNKTVVVDSDITEDGKQLTKTIEYELCLEFTGLRDSEGAEIYEGDKLMEKAERRAIIYLVKWDSDRFCFSIKGRVPKFGNYQAFGNSGQFDEVDVIGNIHEAHL